MANDIMFNKINLRLDNMNSLIINSQQNLSSSIGEIKQLLETEISQIKNDFSNLKNYMLTLENQLDILERKDRALDTILSGIPNFKNEDVPSIFRNICAEIGFDAINTINSIFRVKSKSKQKKTPPPIIVKFKSQEYKSHFFDKYKNYGNLTLSSIQIDSESRIYCNDALTKKNMSIFITAKDLQRRRLITKAFTKKGQVFILKLNCEEPTLIDNIALLKQFSKHTNQNNIFQTSNSVIENHETYSIDNNTEADASKVFNSPNKSLSFSSKVDSLIDDIVDNIRPTNTPTSTHTQVNDVPSRILRSRANTFK